MINEATLVGKVVSTAGPSLRGSSLCLTLGSSQPSPRAMVADTPHETAILKLLSPLTLVRARPGHGGLATSSNS